MNNSNNTGEFLKSLRVAKGLTQIELAEFLNVSNKTVSKWESGVGIPEISTLVILADFYDVRVDDILRGTRRISKNPEKEKNIANYIVSKSEGKYSNYLIIVFGIWLLSNVITIVLGEMTKNSALGMGGGILVMIIGLIIQGINVNYLRQQTTKIDLEDKKKLLNFAFHTSYLFLYLSIAAIYFAGFYYSGNTSSLILILYRLIFSYGFIAVNAIMIYYIIRLFKISFLNKMKTSNVVLTVILFIILAVPMLIVTFSDSYELAIKTNNSYVTHSYYKKEEQEDRYYQLKYLELSDRIHVGDNLRYDENTHKFIYLFDDGYELIMSNQTFSFITSLEYIKFEINEIDATGYIIYDISKFEMATVLYSNFVTPLITLYVSGTFLYFILKKRKQSIQ